MSKPPYRALRIVLGFLSLLMAIEGVLLIFSSKAVIKRVFLHPPEAEISTLLLATLKEMSGLVLMLAVLLFFASRDPERNVAIIAALTVGLCISAVTPLMSFYTLDLGKLYPAYAPGGAPLCDCCWRASFITCGRERHPGNLRGISEECEGTTELRSSRRGAILEGNVVVRTWARPSFSSA